ncbi:WD40-repeat-containing domain protein [Tirmania nivea]|nr:WD40-repeat-containing domain protein [Tirmania nivea]
MATFNQSVRDSLLEMVEQDIRFDKDNMQVVWKRLFAISIFWAEFHRPFFWVIDALDECENGVILLQMIQKIEQHLPIKILITSRKIQELQAQFIAIQKHFTEKRVFSIEISESNSRHDITLYLRAHMNSLPASNARNREKLINTILEKSAGCFLWVQLVVKELEGAFSQQHVDKVLKEVPHEMGALYERAITIMTTKSADSRRYAKSILTWTMCATRPLTITELQRALRLDMGETIDSLEKAIASICGQLVFVDRQMRVQMVHQTARSFLLTADLNSEFTINPVEDHKRLAFACLAYLNSDEMKPPAIRRIGRGPIRKRSEFLNYACTSFSEHIRQSSSEDELLWQQLDWFLKTNILSWIEYIAETGNLYHMTFASKNLSNYLQRLVKYRAPLSPEVRRIKAWAMDLIRLVAKFGNNILKSPSSIYALVPPFCPSESAIASQFGISGRSLVVLGLTNDAWSDQLSCIDYRDPAVAVACGESCFVVGLHYGSIKIYNNTTCQERRSIEQGEYVEQLEFSSSGKLLASCSNSMLKMWDTDSGNLLWCQNQDIAEIMKLSFASGDNVLMAITRKHTVCSWKVSDGTLIEEAACGAIFNDESSHRPPTMAEFSPNMNFVAVAHRGRPIILWDLELQCIDGYLGREANPGKLNGDLALFDPYDHTLLQCTPVNAQKVASSPDGRTLATGNASGMVQLFDFETMKLLYRINGYDYSVRAIAFSSDSLRFLDVRNKMCNVWKPSVLVRRSDEDDCRIADLGEEIDITTVDSHGSGDSIFCGKSDGFVAVYDVQNGNQVGTLCPDNDIPIKCLAWGDMSSILATADVAGNFTVRKVSKTSAWGPWDASTILLDGHSANPINEVILSLDSKLLLVSTIACDNVWDIAKNAKYPLTRIQFTTTGSRISARIFDWASSTELSPPKEIELSTSILHSGYQLKSILTNPRASQIAIEVCKFGYDASPVKVLLCEGSAFNVRSQMAIPSVHFEKLNEHILHLIGFYGTKLVFLDQKL